MKSPPLCGAIHFVSSMLAVAGVVVSVVILAIIAANSSALTVALMVGSMPIIIMAFNPFALTSVSAVVPVVTVPGLPPACPVPSATPLPAITAVVTIVLAGARRRIRV